MTSNAHAKGTLAQLRIAEREDIDGATERADELEADLRADGMGACPECDSPMQPDGGCPLCPQCGYTPCGGGF